MSELSNFIKGQWKAGSGEQLVTINPANGEQTYASNAATAADVNEAVAAAREAFNDWAYRPLEERVAIVTKFRDLLKENAEELAQTISEEVGKPLWEARTEVTTMANKVDISLTSYGARTGESRNKVADGEAVLRHRPHGVFGVFGPYNFPGHLPNGHIVPALIAGNTIVFKPSEYAPRTAIKTVALWEKAGVPAGVVNLVNGGRDTGIALGQSDIDGVLFTGSSQTGAALHKQFAGQTGKLLALEMGGNNPLVVWNVKDIDAAVFMAVSSAFISAGQRCTCARRIIVQKGAEGDAFVQRFVEVASKLGVGAPAAEPAPFMGPVVSAAVAGKLVQAQNDMVAKGGKLLLEMRQLEPNTGFVTAGIVDTTDAKGIADEEWFGPLAQIIRVDNFEDAIRAANATQYGLASGLLSNDEALWQKFSLRARAGIVNWNRPTTGAASSAPFGGVGKSGNHRPSAYYAADYCAYPVASIENSALEMPAKLSPGMNF
ncbi:MAG TPA: succinylglutamate-semialdehyde dehydrogenase [Pseudoduganella sp.]